MFKDGKTNIMGEVNFTGRALAYKMARPDYPREAVEYIRSFFPENSIIADVGAGTGKLTVLLARHGYEIFAIEPNADMREQLAVTLSPFPNIRIIDGSAEATTLPEHSVNVITNAQALNWFDIEAFRTECGRIGKPDSLVITLFNYEPAYDRDKSHGIRRYNKSTSALYRNPFVREFPNPILFNRQNWLLYHSSMAGVPGLSDPGYEAYTEELNEEFDRDSADGLLRLDLVTKVYSEKMELLL